MAYIQKSVLATILLLIKLMYALHAHDLEKIIKSSNTIHLNKTLKKMTPNQLQREIQKKRKGGTTLFLAAVIVNSLECATLLATYALLHDIKININETDNFLMTALHWAASQGNIAFVEYLLKNGANSTLIDCFGWTALNHAQNGASERTARQAEYERCAELIIEAKS